MRRASTSPPRSRRAPHAHAVAAALIAVFAVALPAAAPEPAPRVVAVGDVHGDAAAFASILQRAGLVDAGRRWTGGRGVLVQTGDYLDRGPDVPAVVDLLMQLEKQARDAGGRAHVLMGNHEAMNALGDLRYVAPEAFAHFADSKSERKRQSAFRAHVRLAEARQTALREASDTLEIPGVYQVPAEEAWMQAHPPGYLEYLEAFGPRGKYGRWIRQRPVAVRVGDTIFLHGGLDPDIGFRKIDDATERARTELAYFDRLKEVLVEEKLALPFFSFSETVEAARAEIARETVGSEDPQAQEKHRFAGILRVGGWSIIAANGPLWFRGYATWTDEEGPAQVDRLQQQLGPVRFVVGHTHPDDRRIRARFDNRIFLIDTALSSTYENGRASALEIQDGRYTVITLDERHVIVSDVAAARE